MTNVEAGAAAFEDFLLQPTGLAWSSWLLDRLYETFLARPQATVTDLFRGFDLALRRNAVPLTETVGHLILDVIRAGFALHRVAYQRADWAWASGELAGGVGPARAYLFLLALPPDQATPAALVAILRGLEGTPRFDEAVSMLSDQLERPEVESELRKWRSDGVGFRLADALAP